MKKRKWTRQTYDALHAYGEGGAARERSIRTLTDGGLADVVAELQAASNLGVWYALTREAANAVGGDVVDASAAQAEAELDAMTEAAE